VEENQQSPYFNAPTESVVLPKFYEQCQDLKDPWEEEKVATVNVTSLNPAPREKEGLLEFMRRNSNSSSKISFDD